ATGGADWLRPGCTDREPVDQVRHVEVGGVPTEPVGYRAVQGRIGSDQVRVTVTQQPTGRGYGAPEQHHGARGEGRPGAAGRPGDGDDRLVQATGGDGDPGPLEVEGVRLAHPGDVLVLDDDAGVEFGDVGGDHIRVLRGPSPSDSDPVPCGDGAGTHIRGTATPGHRVSCRFSRSWLRSSFDTETDRPFYWGSA